MSFYIMHGTRVLARPALGHTCQTTHTHWPHPAEQRQTACTSTASTRPATAQWHTLRAFGGHKRQHARMLCGAAVQSKTVPAIHAAAHSTTPCEIPTPHSHADHVVSSLARRCTPPQPCLPLACVTASSLLLVALTHASTTCKEVTRVHPYQRTLCN